MRDDARTGLRLPSTTIRDERLRIALDMLTLMIRDAAGMPVPQQTQLRTAVTSVQAVQRWCAAHGRLGTP